MCADYNDQNIFNTDETGLFYHMVRTGAMKFREEKSVGGKHSVIRCQESGFLESGVIVLIVVNLSTLWTIKSIVAHILDSPISKWKKTKSEMQQQTLRMA